MEVKATWGFSYSQTSDGNITPSWPAGWGTPTHQLEPANNAMPVSRVRGEGVAHLLIRPSYASCQCIRNRVLDVEITDQKCIRVAERDSAGDRGRPFAHSGDDPKSCSSFVRGGFGIGILRVQPVEMLCHCSQGVRPTSLDTETVEVVVGAPRDARGVGGKA